MYDRESFKFQVILWSPTIYFIKGNISMMVKSDQCSIRSIIIHLMKHGIKQIIIFQLQTIFFQLLTLVL